MAAPMVAMFMDPSGGNTSDVKAARELHFAKRALFTRALETRADGGGVKTPSGTKETGVKAAVGAGMMGGMPTAADDG